MISKNLWHNILFLFRSDLIAGVKLWTLFGLAPTFLFPVHPFWKQSDFLRGLSFVHTRDSESNKGKISHSISTRLADRICITLPWGLNIELCSDVMSQFMLYQKNFEYEYF